MKLNKVPNFLEFGEELNDMQDKFGVKCVIGVSQTMLQKFFADLLDSLQKMLNGRTQKKFLEILGII